jgi:hypothetical protein
MNPAQQAAHREKETASKYARREAQIARMNPAELQEFQEHEKAINQEDQKTKLDNMSQAELVAINAHMYAGYLKRKSRMTEEELANECGKTSVHRSNYKMHEWLGKSGAMTRGPTSSTVDFG